MYFQHDTSPSATNDQPDRHLTMRPSAKPEAGFVVHAGLLIPGRGDPIERGCVVVEADTISWVGETGALPNQYRGLPSFSVPVVMPGLWDCHVHLTGMTSMVLSKLLAEHPAVLGARLVGSLRDILNSGFTSVRDLGGLGPELADTVAEGAIKVAPHIYSAGSCISQTAGHGDVFDMPEDWVHSRCGVHGGVCGGLAVIADGADECRKAVRLQLRRGAKVIKMFASGGVLSVRDDPHHSQFSPKEKHAIVDEARRAGRSVAAHAHARDAILEAIDAGCKTIEHGTYLDDECAEVMAENDVLLVPTRLICIEALKHPELLSPESYAKLKALGERGAEAVRIARRHGVKIALGTDLGLSGAGSSSLSHGKSGEELRNMVDLGLDPLQAIECATATAPETLGAQAPRSGQLKAGFDADLIAVESSPLADISVLANPAAISHVWKSGQLLKSPPSVAVLRHFSASDWEEV